jgi:putative DNA primase/helicase
MLTTPCRRNPASHGDLSAQDWFTGRAFIIAMRRRNADESVQRLRYSDRFDDLRRKCVRFVTDNQETIQGADPDVPTGLHDRAADNWTPLLSVADCAGGDWPARARRAAIELSGRESRDSNDTKVQLLEDIRSVFDEAGIDRLASQDLCERLGKLEGHPWAEHGRSQKQISPTQLAKLLRNFDISPRGIRIEKATPKGYAQDAFSDAFSRYLSPNTILSSNTATSTVNIAQNTVLPTATSSICCGTKNGASANKHGACGGVAVGNSEKTGETTKELLL